MGRAKSIVLSLLCLWQTLQVVMNCHSSLRTGGHQTSSSSRNRVFSLPVSVCRKLMVMAYELLSHCLQDYQLKLFPLLHHSSSVQRPLVWYKGAPPAWFFPRVLSRCQLSYSAIVLLGLCYLPQVTWQLKGKCGKLWRIQLWRQRIVKIIGR